MAGTIVSERPPAAHAADGRDGLSNLVQAAQTDTALQQSLATATSLGKPVERARADDYKISVRELQLRANHTLLVGTFWRRASLNAEQRLLFFRKG